MAAATVTATAAAFPDGQDSTQRRLIIYGRLTIQANPATYQTGGLPISFAGITDATALINVTQGPYAQRIEMESRRGSGYVYSFTTVDLWPQNTAVVAGQSIVVANGNQLTLMTVTTGGTTNNTAEPTWVLPAGSINDDGTAVWTSQGITTGLVQIFQSAGSAAPLAEITGNSAIPAGVSGDSINFKAEFVRARA